jgi:hypothetical protein
MTFKNPVEFLERHWDFTILLSRLLYILLLSNIFNLLNISDNLSLLIKLKYYNLTILFCKAY